MPTGARRWKVRIDVSLRPDITLAIRMDHDNVRRSTITSFRGSTFASHVSSDEENGFMIDTCRCDSIQAFYALASRTTGRRHDRERP